jgi:L-fucose mutarotase
MLLGIDPLLSADLLHALATMGHGERIALVDANYPATRGRRLVELPGIAVDRALRAVLTVLPCDTFVPDPATVMQVVGDAGAVPEAVAAMNTVLAAHGWPMAAGIERHDFYAAAAAAYAIVRTGERRLYGNILLSKGVVPPESA